MDKNMALLEILYKNSLISQREIAKELSVSLGSINGMIGKFEMLGLVIIEKKDKKQYEYILTKKGINKRNQNLHKHINECFSTISSVRASIKTGIEEIIQSGIKRIYLVDEIQDEFYRLIKIALLELSRTYEFDCKTIGEFPGVLKDDELIIGCNNKDYIGKKGYINLMDNL